MGCVGLGQWPGLVNFNLLLPKNTRQDSEICASQWDGATQTRPRGGGDAAHWTSCDWAQPPSPGCDGPTGEMQPKEKVRE